jgi:lysophospholipase L1-like esterase
MKRLFTCVLAMGGVLAHAATSQPATTPQIVWTGSWAASPMAQPWTPTNVGDYSSTFRNIVHLTLGGSAIRLRISNEYGSTPLALGSVHVALSAGQSGIQLSSDHKVTFGGSETVTIPEGAVIVSDPVALPVAAFADLAVSIYIPAQGAISAITFHDVGVSSNYIAAGNAAAAIQFDHPRTVDSWFLLDGVDVDAGAGAATVVTLGDSITDGAFSTQDKNARWPDVLAARLHANPATAQIGVLNEGISGNRLLHDRIGTNALARMDRDVLAQSAVKYVVVMLGINDIGRTSQPRKPDDPVTAEQVKWALAQIAARAHSHGLKVYAATLTPYAGAKYQDTAGSSMRDAVNAFIRTSGVFDAVIDFDKVTRDPAHPQAFLPAYDSGDHLHPNDAGYKAMGKSIDLKLFQ